MKNLKNIALALFVSAATAVSAQTKKISADKSTISWVGKKVTGSHSGTINIKSGDLVFQGTKLTGGSFAVDVTSLTVTDLKTGQGKENLEGHLKADDFFGAEKYPTANLVFTSVSSRGNGIYAVKANLTIKDKTNPVSFDLATTAKTANTSFKVDRTKYGIEYNSGNFFQNLGDKAIYDDFELTVSLQY
ncbi:MAG: polyisoprenoid-binding protein YceI [Flavobacterium sp.]|jgi:polyisoprenoid-binding protein YceI